MSFLPKFYSPFCRSARFHAILHLIMTGIQKIHGCFRGKLWFLFTIFSLVSSIASASLNGQYTINQLAAASASNYKSFSAFVNDINYGSRSDGFAANGPGISGNVKVDVVSGSGPYNEQISIDPINGSSATQTLEIHGNGETIEYSTHSTASFVIRLNGCDFVRIDSLTIKSTGASFGRCVEIRNESNHIQIENCLLLMPNMSSTSNVNGYCMVTNGTANPSVFTNPGTNITIRNNKMKSGIDKGPYYGVWISQLPQNEQPNGYEISSNEIADVYNTFISLYYTVGTVVHQNRMHNSGHSREGYIYGVYLYNYLTRCDAIITSNSMFEWNNSSQGNYDGRYPLYVYMYGSSNSRKLEIHNNLIDLHCRYYTPGVYIYALNASNPGVNFYHNTLYFSGKVQNTYTYGLYMSQFYYTDLDCRNNIFYCNWILNGPIYGIYYIPGSIRFDHNLMYLNDIGGGGSVYYGYNGSQYGSLSAWTSAIGGTNNLSTDPYLSDPGAQNWKPTSLQMNNRGADLDMTYDNEGARRDLYNPDIGAFEYYPDLALIRMASLDSLVCTDDELVIKILVKNTGNSDLQKLPLNLAVNDSIFDRRLFNQKLNPGDSAWCTFPIYASFHSGKSGDVWVYLNGNDDNPSNNILSQKVSVQTSPSGGQLNPAAVFNGYVKSGEVHNPDITVTGIELKYYIQNPLNLDNSLYDSTWTLTPFVLTQNGSEVSNGVQFNKPGLSTPAWISYKPDSSMQDSTLFVGIKATLKSSGCDSVFGRYVYVFPSPKPSFNVKNHCQGQGSDIDDQSLIRKGTPEYFWDFGDLQRLDDTSTSSLPVFTYLNPGKYDISLQIRLKEIPKFVFSTSRSIQVIPLPDVDFSVIHACEGNEVKFINLTKINGANPGSIQYRWNFGDQTSSSSVYAPDHLYVIAGGYQVTLQANYAGCSSEKTKNAYQFVKPRADFIFSGACSGNKIEFINKSTIASGNFGSIWNFDATGLSFLSSPEYIFESAGEKLVKLKVVSEFGCADSILQSISIKESPFADFTFENPCSRTPVKFLNETVIPQNIGIQYQWNFDNESGSVEANPSWQFQGMGHKTVTLTVQADNGCKSQISKQFFVQRQALASFVAEDVCEGEPVNFTNLSEVEFGNLRFEWRFGDNTYSSQTAPKKFYALKGQTSTFLVTLKAVVEDGCSDSVTLPVTVNAATSAVFNASVSGRFVQFEPVVKDGSNQYNWRFGEGSRSTEISPSHHYENIDYGTFEVCLGIINQAACVSEYCEQISINLLNSGISSISNFRVFPNPAKETITIIGPESCSINIYNSIGKCLFSADLNGSSHSISLEQFTMGIYRIEFIQANGLRGFTTFMHN